MNAPIRPRRFRLALALLALGGCAPASCTLASGTPQAGGEPPFAAFRRAVDRLLHGPPAPAPVVHYVVGPPYQAGGVWYYPAERFAYRATGIASVYTGNPPEFTADGERYDRTAMAAAHQTLQLPAVARVTNLETGRQVEVRVNDRGPATPARLITVTPRVAELLGFASDGTARVSIELDEAASEALAQRLSGGLAGLSVTAAPRTAVSAEALDPPGGTAAPAVKVPGVAGAAAGAKLLPEVPARLPETVSQGPPRPGRLWIDCGSFGGMSYARMVQEKVAGLGARIERSLVDGAENDAVRIGPLNSIAEADATLSRALRAGAASARIIVE